MKGFIDVYDQRTCYLKDIFIEHGYKIYDECRKNLDFYVLKNYKEGYDHVFSLNDLNSQFIINQDFMFRHMNNFLTVMGAYFKIKSDKKNYQSVLILGYGDLAKQLANVLKNDYDITICNRDYKYINEIKQSYQHLDLKMLIGNYDLIINTIPSYVINYKNLNYKQIYDLAQTVQCPNYQSLRNVPNIYFPYESALLMFQYIHGVMQNV